MIVLLDTSVVVDVLNAQPGWLFESSLGSQRAKALDHGLARATGDRKHFPMAELKLLPLP